MSVNCTGRGAGPFVTDAVKDAVGAIGSGSAGPGPAEPAAGRSAVSQPPEAVFLGRAQLALPLAPVAGIALTVRAADCAPLLSATPVQPVGGVTPAAELSRP